MAEDEGVEDYQPGNPIPPEAVMVRGAPITLDLLRSSARRPLKRHGFYGVSMFAFPGCDADEVARRARIPHDEICEARAGEIEDEGFEIRRTSPNAGHFSLVFDVDPSDEDLQKVLRLFEECKENQHARGRDH